MTTFSYLAHKLTVGAASSELNETDEPELVFFVKWCGELSNAAHVWTICWHKIFFSWVLSLSFLDLHKKTRKKRKKFISIIPSFLYISAFDVLLLLKHVFLKEASLKITLHHVYIEGASRKNLGCYFYNKHNSCPYSSCLILNTIYFQYLTLTHFTPSVYCIVKHCKLLLVYWTRFISIFLKVLHKLIHEANWFFRSLICRDWNNVFLICYKTKTRIQSHGT